MEAIVIPTCKPDQICCLIAKRYFVDKVLITASTKAMADLVKYENAIISFNLAFIKNSNFLEQCGLTEVDKMRPVNFLDLATFCKDLVNDSCCLSFYGYHIDKFNSSLVEIRHFLIYFLESCCKLFLTVFSCFRIFAINCKCIYSIKIKMPSGI